MRTGRERDGDSERTRDERGIDTMKTLCTLMLAALVGTVGACGTDRAADDTTETHSAADGAADEAHAQDGADHREGAGDEEHAGEAHRDEIHLEESQRSDLDIRVAPAGEGRAGTTVSAPATVAFDLDRVTRVGPRVQAKVVRVTRDLGDHVEAGETVAVLDSPDLGRAKAAYLSAQAGLEAAEAHYERDKLLAEDRIVSQNALQESRARYHQAQAERDAALEELRLLGLGEVEIGRVGSRDVPLSRYELQTPRGGMVQRRDLVPGETVGANETPIHVVDTGVMWVLVDAYEQDLPRLALAQPMTLRIAVLPDRVFAGEVDWISAALDETSRTVRLRAVVDNPDGVLRAGMFGTADIATADGGGGGGHALVPVDALQSLEGRSVVFVPAPGHEGAYRAVEVVPGDEAGGEIEIRRGLEPGDPVVVEGAFDLMSALTARERSAAHSH